MTTTRSRIGRLTAMGFALALAAPALHAQTTTMPSTLRYGSGYLDVPVASVLPHLAITGTYSGFFVDNERSMQIDAAGDPAGFDAAGVDEFFQDASVTVGLFDRAEIGATLQSFNDENAGSNMWGVFGRLALLKPTNQGLGLAVGGRYVTAPDFGDGVNYQPGRLGYPDDRLREEYAAGGAEDVNTELSIYGVATGHFRGFEQEWLPRHDFTATLGYGTGMFQEGGDLAFYQFANSNGWFFGSGLHIGVGESAVVSLLGEYNGFDVNLGAQVDVSGIRVGAHVLGVNYSEPDGGYFSTYRTPKFGVLGSIALCPAEGGLCSPNLMERPEPETVQLPAPPPDTVRITREVERPLPDGTPASVCLATGEAVQVRVSAQGDTLVGPMRTDIDDLRPGVVFAGSYAEGATWFQDDAAVTFEDRRYDKSGGEVRLDCGQIMRVGEHMGVPLFAMRDAERPFDMIYVPARPGVWQAYEFGLQRTRGE